MKDNLKFRTAEAADLETLISMLADDKLGKLRENFQTPLPKPYLEAFEQVDQDPNCQLVVATIDDNIVGMAQINFLVNLTYQGGTRAQIEGVRVHKDFRSHGIGKQLFEYLIDLAKQRGCHMAQLTTNNQRPDAYHFYEKLGFKHSHAGFKLELKV